MTRHTTLRLIAAGALYCSATVFTSEARAAISFADIQIWAGSGSNQAAMVIDWGDGSAPLVWGYRWDSLSAPTGNDMLSAIVGADSRLNVPGLSLSTNFVSQFKYDANNDGIFERDRTTMSAAPFAYWGYNVNNDVYFDPVDFNLNSHIVPPNTTVVPNGNPYAAASPGSWVGSSTGILYRPLVNGSWDGFAYGEYNLNTFGDPSPGVPIAAMPIPEPAALALICLVAGTVWQRRRAA